MEGLALIDLHAVGIEHLPVPVAIVDVVGIILAAGVGLLDASAGRCVITGDGNAEAAAVIEIERLLHEALPERTAADYPASVVILDGSGEDFAGRCGVLVDQHVERYLLQFSSAGSSIILTLAVAPFQINYQCILGQEHVGQVEGLVEETAAVVAQVEYQTLHPLG